MVRFDNTRLVVTEYHCSYIPCSSNNLDDYNLVKNITIWGKSHMYIINATIKYLEDLEGLDRPLLQLFMI